MHLKRCACHVPEPRPFREGAQTSVCIACGGWFTLIGDEIEDWDEFKAMFNDAAQDEDVSIYCAQEPAPIGPPVEDE